MLRNNGIIWGKNHDLVWHGSMTVPYSNEILTTFVRNCDDTHYNPLDKTQLLSVRDRFLLHKIITTYCSFVCGRLVNYINDYNSKVMMFNYKFNKKIKSQNSVSDKHFFSPKDEEIVDCLYDPRCITFRYGLQPWIKHPQNRNSIYLTPKFLRHFDFTHICKVKMLNSMVNFVSY